MSDQNKVQQAFPELGIYTLPGKVDDPERCLDEITLAEELGLGSIWVGERYDYKNAAVICGAAGAITSRIKIATGLVNYPTHHPMELCSFGATMAGLSGERFAMGMCGRTTIDGIDLDTLGGISPLQTLFDQRDAGRHQK